jgi:hypothetical protein
LHFSIGWNNSIFKNVLRQKKFITTIGQKMNGEFDEPPPKKMKWNPIDFATQKFLKDIYKLKKPEIPQEFFQNFEFYEKIIKVEPKSLEYFPQRIQNNKNIVMEAVSKIGFTIKFASGELKNNSEIVQIAISNDFRAYLFASSKLQSDEDIMLHTLKKSKFSWENLSQDKFKSKKVLMHRLNYGGLMNFESKYLPKEFLKDPEFVKELISSNGIFLNIVDDSFKSDFNTVMTAVNQNGMSLEFAREDLKSKKEIV